MSLLTITSHHHEYRSHNAITFHHSKVIDRQLPVSSQHELGYDKHGSRVTVRNLFGNLPVRVKQRAVTAEHKAEHEKLRDTLKQSLTALVLGWQQAISLKIRDADNRVIFQVGGHIEPTPGRAEHRERSKTLRAALHTLTQSELLSIADWDNWVPVAATTSVMTIKGAISLDPSPTKLIQFISLDIQPLLAGTGHNVLYDQVNRLFALSSFGTIQESETLDESKKSRRMTDKRFKSEEYTTQKFHARKGVDRYPMFFLKIQLKDPNLTRESNDDFFDQDTNLQTVSEVINVMLTQWLSTHHFHPRKLRSKQPSTQLISNAKNGTDRSERAENSGSIKPKIDASRITSSPSTLPPKAKKRQKRSALTPSHSNSEVPRHTPFTDWSRIKSGKADFYQNIWSSKPKTADDSLTQEESSLSTESVAFNVDPVLPGTFAGNCSRVADQQAENERSTPSHPSQGDDNVDQTIEWYDTVTKKTYFLNSRTGCVVSEMAEDSKCERSLPVRPKTLRLQRRPTSRSQSQGPFLSGVLGTWENPIFAPSRVQIKQVSIGDRCSGTHSHARVDLERAFNETSLHKENKLSKDGLRHAHVIAQVDKKFILARMTQIDDNDTELLVLIDQHAADERIRVESLLAEFCTPLEDSRYQNYRSRLGHSSRVPFAVLDKPIKFSISSQEHDVFFRYAAQFGGWGILYDLVKQDTIIRLGEIPSQILVITLPLVISERCKSDPKMVIDFLRSAVWKYTERLHIPLNPPELLSASQENGNKTPSWVKSLSTCPEGLVDIINSRACRSAIMFNDELSLQECQELVARLSNCIFPFMCAHGRPSMVPLVNLGTPDNNTGIVLGNKSDEIGKYEHDKTFVEAWKAWQAPG